jgi:hypothetical protein
MSWRLSLTILILLNERLHYCNIEHIFMLYKDKLIVGSSEKVD